MLRITVHEDSGSWRMKLEGKLGCAWAAVAESTWRTANIAGKKLEVDLRGVTRIDDAGYKLLKEMKRAGVEFLTEGIELKALMSESASEAQGRVRHLVSALALAFLILPFTARAQESPAPLKLTLQDAVTLALKQNPQIAIANLNLIQSQADQKIARSGLLPQASLHAQDNLTRGNIQSLLGTKIPGFPQHNGPFWAIQAGPQFSTPLFDLTLWRRWQAAGEAVHTSAAQQNTARELNAQLVVSQYLGSLRAAADVKAASSRLNLAKALFDLAGDLQKNGVGTGIDTLRAHVQFQNETQRYTEAATQLKVSLYGLSRLLNLDPQQSIELADEASFFETPAFSSSDSLLQAYQERPELRTILSQIKEEEFRTRAAKSERLPRLAVGGTWTLGGLTPTTMIPVYQYGATLDVPIFTGGRIEAEVTSHEIELKKLAQEEREMRNRIALEVKSAIAQLDSAKTEVEAANLGVSLAGETVRQSQDRFKAGVANNIEVITAQDELARANDNQINALYRYNQSRADLAHATGKMEALYAK